MGEPLRVIIVVENEDKAVLLLQVLRLGGFDPVEGRVRTAEDLDRLSSTPAWDVAVIDEGCSAVDALIAVERLRAGGSETSAVVVSSGASEARLVAFFLAGAQEHLRWDEVGRLPEIVKQELEAAKARRALKGTDEVGLEGDDLFKVVFEHSPDGLYICDLAGTIVDANRAAERLAGLDRKELIGRNFLELKILSPKDALQAAKILARNALKKSTGPDALTVIHRDGSTAVVEVRAIPVNIGGRRLIVGIARDVTERDRAEAEIQESRELYRLLLLNANDGILVHELHADAPGRFLEVNDRASRELGYTRDELLSMSVSDIEVPEQRGRTPAIVDALAKTGQAFYETEHLAKDGTRIPVEVSARMFNFKGRPVVLSIVRDIRERKSSERERAEALERLRISMRGIIQVIAQTIEMRDPYTAGHQRRAADLARAIATEMGLSAEVIDGIRVTGQIHDVGKVAIPAEILSKPTKLSPLEYDLVKTHAEVGYEILKGVEFPWPVAETIFQHHERLDGSGYPRGLKGESLLLEAKILMVADVVEAMMTHRPFRPAYGVEAALKEISMFRGRHYEPAVVDACVRLFREKGFKFRD